MINPEIKTVMNDILDRINGIMSGHKEFLPLYCFGPNEQFWDFLNGLLIIISAILTFVSTRTISAAIRSYIEAASNLIAILTPLINIYAYVRGQVSFWVAMISFVSLIPIIVDIIVNYLMPRLSWLQKIIISTEILAKLATDPGRAIFLANIVALALSVGFWIIGFISDLYDDDYNPGPNDDVASYPWEIL